MEVMRILVISADIVGCGGGGGIWCYLVAMLATIWDRGSGVSSS
jgi:hypothetical protein